jgi:small-conductance mechanosensitive channel
MTIKTSVADLPVSQQLSALFGNFADWVSSHANQIMVAILVGAALVAILYAIKMLGIWLCRAGQNVSPWRRVLGETLSRTRFWFMAAVAAQIIIWLGRAPPEFAQPFRVIFVTAVGFQAAVWARALILGLAENRSQAGAGSENIQSAMGLIRVLVTATLFIVAMILILANIGVNVTGLLAGLGIGGIAIGLAAQGIFSDLFAALSILFDKPFRKGDLIRFDQTTGTVEYIGLKSSRIRALSGEEIIISNANLLGKELRNFARVEVRRVNQVLTIVCETPVERLAAMSDILQPAIDACDGAEFQRVGLNTFSPSALDFMLVYDIEASDQADILARKNDVNLAVLSALKGAGIAMAYPTQTTYTASPDGTLVMPNAQPPSDTKVIKRKK